MTSLSAKMTGYKSKSQQPSVALNTQPLSSPTNLSPSKEEPSSVKTTPEKPTLKAEETPSAKTNNTNPTKIEETIKKEVVSDSYNSGWGVEDDDWKDLEDDEQMEPLDVEYSKPKEQNQSMSRSSSSNNYQKTDKSNNDWSEWSNSFDNVESLKTKVTTVKSNISNNKANSPQYAHASSYNWTNSNSNQKEEDIFSNLVKDIKVKFKLKSHNFFIKIIFYLYK